MATTSSTWITHSTSISVKDMIELQAALRRVFEEHTKYTALFICAAIDGTPAVPALVKRLQTLNSKQIADSIAVLIGKQTQVRNDMTLRTQIRTLANALNEEFQAHIGLAAAIVGELPKVAGGERNSKAKSTAVHVAIGELLRAGGTLFEERKSPKILIQRTGVEMEGSGRILRPGFEKAGATLESKIGAWYYNAEKIVKLLAKNTFVLEHEQGATEEVLRDMFYEHLDQTLVEARLYYFVSLPDGGANWIASVDDAAYHMVKISDMLHRIFMHD